MEATKLSRTITHREWCQDNWILILPPKKCRPHRLGIIRNKAQQLVGKGQALYLLRDIIILVSRTQVWLGKSHQQAWRLPLVAVEVASVLQDWCQERSTRMQGDSHRKQVCKIMFIADKCQTLDIKLVVMHKVPILGELLVSPQHHL